jgi:PST family polysaccharide transporter
MTAVAGSAAPESSPEWFKTEHLEADLARRSVRGGAATVTAQVMKFAIHTGSTMILARLLTPADYGLVAMVAAFTGFAMLFRDPGLSMATIQRAEINHGQVSTLFWANVTFSAALMVLAMSLAPAVAWLYHEPRLTWITIGIAAQFLLGGLSAQHTAMIRRQMRFTALVAAELTSAVVGCVAAICLALYGAGYWALVAMPGMSSLTHMIIVWSLVPWRPGKPSLGREVKEMVRFGGNLTGFNCVRYLTRNVDNALIGAFWGASPLGIYAKAYGILLLPLQQINSPVAAVAIPTLSRLQDNPAQYRRVYCRIIQLIAYLTMPLVVLLAILSNEVILIVLGDQWTAAAGIFRILAFWALLQPLVTTLEWIFVSLGRTHRMLRFGMVTSTCAVISFAVGLPWGPVGVATAGTISFAIVTIPSMIYALTETPISLTHIWTALSRPVLLSILVGVAGIVVHHLIASPEPMIRVAFVVLAALATAAGAFVFWRSIRDDARLILSLAYK